MHASKLYYDLSLNLVSCNQVIKEELYDDAMGYIIVFVKFGNVFIDRLIYESNQGAKEFVVYQLLITANTKFDSHI